MMRIATACWFGFVGLYVLTGCSAHTPAALRYGAILADGDSLPVRIAGRDECDGLLTAAALELTDTTFQLTTTVHRSCATHGETVTLPHTGRLLTRGDTLVFLPRDRAEAFTGTALQDDVVVSLFGSLVTFRRGHQASADVQEFYAREVRGMIERQAAELVTTNLYDCQQDSILDAAPPIGAADTLGLGVRIAAHFPAWRLTTEREIACRFPLARDTRPEVFWAEWGSGRAWWIWKGDFDADRRTDELVLLSSRDDPRSDLLVVLFGKGGAATVATPGGWGVDVRAAADVGQADANQPRDGGDAILLLYWDKATEVLRWRDGRFRNVEGGDASR